MKILDTLLTRPTTFSIRPYGYYGKQIDAQNISGNLKFVNLSGEVEFNTRYPKPQGFELEVSPELADTLSEMGVRINEYDSNDVHHIKVTVKCSFNNKYGSSPLVQEITGDPMIPLGKPYVPAEAIGDSNELLDIRALDGMAFDYVDATFHTSYSKNTGVTSLYLDNFNFIPHANPWNYMDLQYIDTI